MGPVGNVAAQVGELALQVLEGISLASGDQGEIRVVLKRAVTGRPLPR